MAIAVKARPDSILPESIEVLDDFCRAEAYAGTGLEAKLVPEGRLLGDYFGFDDRLKDPRSEAFHQIANYAFFERNFSDDGLHYFNMEVDFCFQLLRRFHPETLTQTLRRAVRNFIKQTNLDTYQWLCRIYDYVDTADPGDQRSLRSFAWEMRQGVDAASAELHERGEQLLRWLDEAYERRGEPRRGQGPDPARGPMPFLSGRLVPYRGQCSWEELKASEPEIGWDLVSDPLGTLPRAIPYDEFQRRLAELSGANR